jgi:hypothetical protein
VGDFLVRLFRSSKGDSKLMRARLGDEVLFLERSFLALGDFFVFLCTEDEDMPNKLLLSNLFKPLDDNFLLFSEDEDRPELLLLSNLSKPLDEDRLMSAKLHVWLAKPLFDLDGFLPFPCSDEEERLMSDKRGAEEIFLTESLFAVDDFRLVSCSGDEHGSRSANPSIFIRSLLPSVAFLLPPCSDDGDKQRSGMSIFVMEDTVLLPCSIDGDRLATIRFHVLLYKSLSVFDDFRASPYFDVDDGFMSGKFHAALILVGESLLDFSDFVLFLFSFDEDRPKAAKLGDDLLCLDKPLLFLDDCRLLTCSVKGKSGKFHAAFILVCESLLDFGDFVLFLFSFEEYRPMAAKLGDDLLCLDKRLLFLDDCRLLTCSGKGKSLLALDDLV